MDNAMIVFEDDRSEKRALIEEVMVKQLYDPFVGKFPTREGQMVHVYEKTFLCNLDNGDVPYRMVGLDEMKAQMTPSVYGALEKILGIGG